MDEAESSAGVGVGVGVGIGADAEVPTYVRLLWGSADESKPGPKRSLDLQAIAAAGVRLADAGGLDAVSMRSVGKEVGLTSMAIYRYVPDKRELLGMVVDEALGPPRLPEEGDWRARLRAWAAANRARLLAHPWVLDVPMTEPSILPNHVAWMEHGLAALAGTGLAEQQKLSLLLLVDVYVRGQAQLSLSMTGPPEVGMRYAARLRALADRTRFPHLTAALGSGSLEDDSDFAPEEFVVGLEIVLDGIAAQTARAARR